jgi:hypothetical protein
MRISTINPMYSKGTYDGGSVHDGGNLHEEKDDDHPIRYSNKQQLTIQIINSRNQ